MTPIIGTAAWGIPRKSAPCFPTAGSALERYASRFSGVEINSSFYRAHRPATWARWGESVPADFRFALKMPRTISHERRLAGCADLVARFLDETAPLGAKRAVLLLQLPPKFAYDDALVGAFLAMLTELSPAAIACEPRHPSWFESGPDHALARLRVARVAADPACVPAAAQPGGWRGLTYWRLHGSPRIYRSSYDDGRLDVLARQLGGVAVGPSWCIFDNTASGAATDDALALSDRLAKSLNRDTR